MRIYLICFCLSLSRLLLATHYEPTFSEEKTTLPTIKILIGENVEGALVEAKGPYLVIDPYTNKELSRGSRLKRYYLQQQPDGLKWGEGYPGIFQIKIIPQEDKTSILIDGIQYKGAVEIYSVDGQIHLVNDIPIETYLKACLSKAFTKNLPSKVSLDALAIVARTDLYYTAIENKRTFWHLHAKKVGYNGYAVTRPEIDRAVDNTQYLIMLHKNRPFPTTWTENCAGTTSDFRSIFRKDIDVPEGVASPYARKDREQYHWQYTISINEFEKRIPIQGLKGIDLYRDPKTDKVYGVRIRGSREMRCLDFQEFWVKMGKTHVRSNDMKAQLDTKNQQVLFEGYGDGPGVGLCVFSANMMAKNGDTAPQILANFYPFTSLTRLEMIPNSMLANKEEFIKQKKKR